MKYIIIVKRQSGLFGQVEAKQISASDNKRTLVYVDENLKKVEVTLNNSDCYLSGRMVRNVVFDLNKKTK